MTLKEDGASHEAVLHLTTPKYGLSDDYELTSEHPLTLNIIQGELNSNQTKPATPEVRFFLHSQSTGALR